MCPVHPFLILMNEDLIYCINMYLETKSNFVTREIRSTQISGIESFYKEKVAI